MLGGWAAEVSEARVSKFGIMNVQRQVARTFSDATSTDPLCELETLKEFAVFLKREGASETESSRYLNLISKRDFVAQARETESQEPQPGEPQQ